MNQSIIEMLDKNDVIQSRPTPELTNDLMKASPVEVLENLRIAVLKNSSYALTVEGLCKVIIEYDAILKDIVEDLSVEYVEKCMDKKRVRDFNTFLGDDLHVDL